MLHHPFADWPDLLSVVDVVRSYIDISCKQLHTHPPDFYNDPEGDGFEEDGSDSDSDSGDDDPHEVRKEHPLADFEAFARRRPGVDFTAPGDSLGNLESDCSYDLSTHIDRYVELYPEIVDQIKADNPIDLSVDFDSCLKPESERAI